MSRRTGPFEVLEVRAYVLKNVENGIANTLSTDKGAPFGLQHGQRLPKSKKHERHKKALRNNVTMNFSSTKLLVTVKK